MRVGTPPLQVCQQVWGLLRRRPGAACQRGSAMANREIDPFNTGSVEPSREAQSLEDDSESVQCSKPPDRASLVAACAVGRIFSPGRRSGPLPPAIGAQCALGDPAGGTDRSEP
jgi:hypothetical protein